MCSSFGNWTQTPHFGLETNVHPTLNKIWPIDMVVEFLSNIPKHWTLNALERVCLLAIKLEHLFLATNKLTSNNIKFDIWSFEAKNNEHVRVRLMFENWFSSLLDVGWCLTHHYPVVCKVRKLQKFSVIQFYVKSKLTNLESQNLPFLQLWEALNSDF